MDTTSLEAAEMAMLRGGDLRIGKLRQSVTFEKPVRSEDPRTGEPLTFWSIDMAGVPAMVVSSQSESERGGKLVAVTRHEIGIRYVSQLEGKTVDRVVIEGVECEITASIDPDKRKRWLIITAIATV